MTHQDRPFLGILFMLGFCMLVPIGDATAKYLGSYIPLLTLVFIRFAMQIVLLYPIIWLNGYSTRMSRRVLGLTILRTGLHIIGLGAMFAALMYLPLADAIAIAFVMPFIMLLLGKYVLGEQVGRHRLIACAVGFAGTLMVVQPSFAAVGGGGLCFFHAGHATGCARLRTRGPAGGGRCCCDALAGHSGRRQHADTLVAGWKPVFARPC